VQLQHRSASCTGVDCRSGDGFQSSKDLNLLLFGSGFDGETSWLQRLVASVGSVAFSRAVVILGFICGVTSMVQKQFTLTYVGVFCA
jgi:hypothetical protein